MNTLQVGDSLRLNFLPSIISGEVSLEVGPDGNRPLNYVSAVRSAESRLRVCGKFNLSESPDGSSLSVRPFERGGSIALRLSIRQSLSLGQSRSLAGGNSPVISLIRGATKNVEAEIPLNVGRTTVDISPSGDSYSDSYSLAVYHEPPDAELEVIEARIASAEDRLADIQRRRSEAREKLARIEEECGRDYDALQREFEEMSSRSKADAAILEHYRDNDIADVTALLREAEEKLNAAEVQIRIFIETRQKKSAEIENQIKSVQTVQSNG